MSGLKLYCHKRCHTSIGEAPHFYLGTLRFYFGLHYLSSKTLLAEIKSYQLYINYLSY